MCKVMSYREDVQSLLAACGSIPLRKRACTYELKGLNERLTDLTECLNHGWLHGERISQRDIDICKAQIQYVTELRASL